jgi:uncharacterized pyridoxal phosphate-containing UPF0001 family protein
VAPLTERLAAVRQRVDELGGTGRVSIVAVTKALGVERVADALDAGLVDLGENYAAELRDKAATVDRPVAWHYLGAVQRQAATLGSTVALWHGVDSEKAGRRVAAAAPGAAVMVQVNLSGQPQRQGCTWEAAPALVEDLATEGLEVRGLMGVAGDDAVTEFRRLVRLGAELGLPAISAGMSGDYEVAVSEGSTMIRLGTALFGPRPTSSQMRR